MSVASPESVRVVMFPDLVSTDPYSDLLDEALRQRGVSVERGTALEPQWARREARHLDAVHLHWLEFLFYSTGSRGRRLVSMYVQGLRVVRALRILRGAGVRVLWTVHNPSPHETDYPRLHRLLRRAVLDSATGIVVHSHYAKDRARETMRFDAPVSVAPHGGYRGVYPPSSETRADVRRRLSIPDDAFVYLVFGHIRAYKRVPDAIRAFSTLADADARMLVVGAAGPPREETEAAANEDPRVILDLRSLPETEVAAVFQAADTLVLNYSEVFSSGALLLARTFGLPVVAPASGSAEELAPPPATVPFTEGALPSALAIARTDHDQRRRAMEAASASQTWDESARVLEGLYRGGAEAAVGDDRLAAARSSGP